MTAVQLQRGSAAIPEAEHTKPPTPHEALDEAVAALQAQKDAWLRVSVGERIEILRRLLSDTVAQSERWVIAAVNAKRLVPGTPPVGEEWIAGPACLLRNIQLLIRSLQDIRDHGVPQLPSSPKTLPNGQVVVQVFPTDKLDGMTFQGFTGEVWMQPGVTAANLRDHMAEAYRTPPTEGKVALVLGAGNVSSIGPMDALYKLFNESQVVVLKMNPVNEYLGPIFEDCFRTLVDRGFFRVVYGGGAEGAHLCEHPGVDEIHITGSDKTHDAIVFGVGEEGRENKESRTPRNTRRITSELGNVSPIIVVPGPWSQGDLDFQGENLASSLANNAGFNCNATRVIIQHQGWSQRRALLDSVRRAFTRAPDRAPYYPGAVDRFRAFVDAHPEAEKFGAVGEGRVPWTLIPGLDPSSQDDICFTTEAFCAVTSEMVMPASDTVDFIRKAVDFCNDKLWGSLNAAIVVHPKSLEEPGVQKAVDDAIADLRYGSVAVNHWPALSYGFVSTTWGAYPGHDIYDVRSGIGVVHNTYMFDRPQKSVVRGPFVAKPKPAWFITHRTAHKLLRKIAYFNADPKLGKLPGIIFDALRG